jgi:hypothetical protein
MNLSRSLLLLLPCTVAFAQTSDLFNKAAPEVDEALRARVTLFYDAYISGKYSHALKVVAEDAVDDFMGATKDTYKSCEISKITYSDEFNKATVVTACKGELVWRGQRMPATLPLISNWKMVDGQWFWYAIRQTERRTPFGLSGIAPVPPGGEQRKTVIPPDPNALAREILSQVSIDKTAVELRQSQLSQGEVHVTNKMPGPITLSVDKLPVAGMNVKIDSPEVPSGGKATITFLYDPNDPSISCGSCMAHAQLPAISANIHVSPTARIFAVKITFASEAQTGNALALPKPKTE